MKMKMKTEIGKGMRKTKIGKREMKNENKNENGKGMRK